MLWSGWLCIRGSPPGCTGPEEEDRNIIKDLNRGVNSLSPSTRAGPEHLSPSTRAGPEHLRHDKELCELYKNYNWPPPVGADTSQ